MRKEFTPETKTEKAVSNYGYYSRVLGKVFDNLDDLLSAEKEHEDAKLAEKEKARVKKEKAAIVEKAYIEYVETAEKANKEIADAQNNYIKLRDEFIKEYGSFHMSYSNEEKEGKCNRDVRVSDTLGNIFDVFRSFPLF